MFNNIPDPFLICNSTCICKPENAFVDLMCACRYKHHETILKAA